MSASSTTTATVPFNVEDGGTSVLLVQHGPTSNPLSDLGRALHEDARGLPRQIERGFGAVASYELCRHSNLQTDMTTGRQRVHHVQVESQVGLLAWSRSPVMLESARQQVCFSNVDTEQLPTVVLKCHAVHTRGGWDTREF
jgi:hypothetical protein